MCFVTIWDTLGKKHAIDVLLEIYENPGEIQGKIADRSEDGSGTRRARLPELEKIGLIKCVDIKGSRPTKSYYVTTEGERICKLLLQIRDGDEHRTSVVHGTHQEDVSVTEKK